MILDQIERALMNIGHGVLVIGGATPLDKNKNKNYKSLPETHVSEPSKLIETRMSLNNMTKKDICRICKERYNIVLDSYAEKKYLITEFLSYQNLYSQ